MFSFKTVDVQSMTASSINQKVIRFPDVYWPECLGNEHLTVLSNIIEYIYPAVLTFGLTKIYYISYLHTYLLFCRIFGIEHQRIKNPFFNCL